MSPIHGYRVRIEPDQHATGTPDSVKPPWSYGACLYLGSRGQRCDRPALEDGFCARHSPDAVPLGPGIWFRRLAALLVAAAILWPIVEAFLEELFHWRH